MWDEFAFPLCAVIALVIKLLFVYTFRVMGPFKREAHSCFADPAIFPALVWC